MRSKLLFIVSSVLIIGALALSIYISSNNDIAPEDSEASNFLVSETIPQNQRHPDAGVWMAYPNSPLSSLADYPYISEVQGVMAYQKWVNLFNSNNSGSFTWSSLDSVLHNIINVADKKAFLDVTAGYCPDLPIPEYLTQRIATRKEPNGMGCNPLQYWDPQFLNEPSPNNYTGYYYDYMVALAEHLAYFDTHDDRPNTTDITFVRAMVMADTMENLAGADEIAAGEWNWSEFNPGSLNGRIHQQNLTDSINRQYYKRVSNAYVKALNDAYNEVGLIPPMVAPKMNGHWNASQEQNELADAGHVLWTTNSGPVPPGGWYFGYIQKAKTGITRGHTESRNNMNDVSILSLWNYWEILANVHAGVEFIGVYGKNRGLENTHPTLQPYGPIGFRENYEALKLANKYAGVERSPATAPGAFLALRGWYPEWKFGGLEHETMWSDYGVLLTHDQPQDSVMLFGRAAEDTFKKLNPLVKRNSQQTTASWQAEIDLCDNPGEWPVSECNYIHQPPSIYEGRDGNNYVYSYPHSDLGNVQFCGEDMFCTNGGSVTRTEPMFWARRTDRANGNNYMRFNMNDAFANSLGSVGSRRVTIRVVYLDRGTDRWQLIRDNNIVVGTITKTNTNLWKEAFFDVTNASFNNSGTNTTDLALYNNNDSDDIFHMIEVMRVTSTPTVTPTPTTTITPAPTNTAVSNLSLTPASCLSGPTSTGTALTISWTNPASGPNANMVQIGTTSSFTPVSYRKNSSISGTSSTTAPVGFSGIEGGVSTGEALIMNPNTTYYVRVWNGAYTPTQTVTIPSCQVITPTPTPTPRPTVTFTPTPTPTPTSIPTTAGYCGDGIVQRNLGEQCDDGNTSENDECMNSCRYKRVFIRWF